MSSSKMRGKGIRLYSSDEKGTNVAEWAGMGFVIAPSPLHSAQMIPLLSAEKALVGDLGRVIFLTGSTVERKKQERRGRGG